MSSIYSDAVLKFLSKYCDVSKLNWDGEYPFQVNCDDLFCEDTPDVEAIELADFTTINRCFIDAPRNAWPLWIARKRGMRPQGRFYQNLLPYEAALFDSCGPEREIGDVNPLPNLTAQFY